MALVPIPTAHLISSEMIPLAACACAFAETSARLSICKMSWLPILAQSAEPKRYKEDGGAFTPIMYGHALPGDAAFLHLVTPARDHDTQLWTWCLPDSLMGLLGELSRQATPAALCLPMS